MKKKDKTWDAYRERKERKERKQKQERNPLPPRSQIPKSPRTYLVEE